ncbi:Crp/Fnr family transcriptional regulator [Synergistes jonesii]|uniref:Crp/Fnr family transcriptional regulator n=1 Tax=Synergistes jonesii TaxID=2754 RepID=UPI00248EE423|nr:Crp/Fnr family transcriptional regulator [Synergistes jonesii]
MLYSFLSNTALFRDIREDEAEDLLGCLDAREKHYRKGEIIYRAGDAISEIGLIVSGSVNIIVNFYWGNSNIFGHASAGELFAEAYAAIPGKELLCDVVAAEESDILFVDMERLLTTCKKGCAYHHQLIHNLLQISANKNLALFLRMMYTAPKSIRERVMLYLSAMAQETQSDHFAIPFSRQQLADYLGVDRSALSKELSRMQKDGLLSYCKNYFALNSNFSKRF